MESIGATVILILSLIMSLIIVMLLTIAARRLLLNLFAYRGKPMLAAAVAIATLAVIAVLGLVALLVGRAWLQVAVGTTILAGLLIAGFLMNRKIDHTHHG